MFSEMFWTLLITTVSGCCLVLIRGLLKSKCKSFDCCGIKIERDVKIEEEIEMEQIRRNPISPTASL